MNLFTNLLFTFIFLNIMIYFKFPNINSDSYVQNKFMLFISVFLFQIAIAVMVNIKNNCKIVFKDIVQNSLMQAIFAVIGYSIYIDLMIMGSTKEYMKNKINPAISPIIVSIVITFFMAAVKLAEMSFTNKFKDSCIKQ